MDSLRSSTVRTSLYHKNDKTWQMIVELSQQIRYITVYVGFMLDQRLRRWSNMKTTRSFSFAGQSLASKIPAGYIGCHGTQE